MTTNHEKLKDTANIVQFIALDEDIQQIIKIAVEVRTKAYCPYSKFAVGACLLSDDGTSYSGCNIENAAFPSGICAEMAAYGKAVSDGKQKFKAISVVAYQERFFTPPCGSCRQFMSEFGDVDVYISKPQMKEVLVTSLHELLPLRFNPDNVF